MLMGMKMKIKEVMMTLKTKNVQYQQKTKINVITWTLSYLIYAKLPSYCSLLISINASCISHIMAGVRRR